MKKAIKAIVGIALALSFAAVPSAINSGNSTTSSIATVSASAFVVVRNPHYNPRYHSNLDMFKKPYMVYYQGQIYGYSYTPYIG